MVNPGSPPHRHQTRSKANPTRPYHRMVTLAQSSPGGRSARALQSKKATVMLVLALQLPFLQVSESMGNHDSEIVDARGVD
jgi:hypothetical protein